MRSIRPKIVLPGKRNGCNFASNLTLFVNVYLIVILWSWWFQKGFVKFTHCVILNTWEAKTMSRAIRRSLDMACAFGHNVSTKCDSDCNNRTVGSFSSCRTSISCEFVLFWTSLSFFSRIYPSLRCRTKQSTAITTKINRATPPQASGRTSGNDFDFSVYE